MHIQKIKTDFDILRNSALIAGRTRKMALPYIGSTLCVAAVTAIDSMVAGISISSAALAAVAAAAPLLAVKQILHCLLGYGIDKLMIQAIGKGKRKEADRIFGAILIAVFAVFLAVTVPLLVFARPLLQLMINDPALIDLVILYTRPLLAASPVFEVFLCIERAFRIDGRAKLLALRSLYTSIGNILLDILMVSVFKLGISGLAWSSVISTLIGYCASLSHFFSKKRTVTPDLTVIFSMKELLSYLKEDVRLGSSATLDELLEMLLLTVQTGVISGIGGTGGLAVWAVYRTLRGIVLSLSNGISASVSIHAGLLYGQRDYDGVRFSIKASTQFASAISLAAILLVLPLAGPIADAFRIEPEYHTLCAQCLRIGALGFPPIALLTVFTACLPAVNRVWLTNLLVALQNGLLLLTSFVGYCLGLTGFFAGYVLALCAVTLILVVLLKRDRSWFVPENNPEEISSYSIRIEPAQFSAMSAAVYETLSDSYPTAFCSRAALVAEDCMSLVALHNPGKEIRADIMIRRHGDGAIFTIIDDGAAYNPFNGIDEADNAESDALETMIVLGLSAEKRYDRVLDLNFMTLCIKSPAQNHPLVCGKKKHEAAIPELETDRSALEPT